MNNDTYYAAKAAYEEGCEDTHQSYCEILLAREKLLSEWLKLAYFYGWHCEGLDEKTREILPPQLLPTL